VQMYEDAWPEASNVVEVNGLSTLGNLPSLVNPLQLEQQAQNPKNEKSAQQPLIRAVARPSPSSSETRRRLAK
jgi:hypothetical protein